ncbi:MAG: MotA/TolQ/ExbB proton channel family protein [Myxococcota bacterium]
MVWLNEALLDVRVFLETGGTTMNVIFLTAVVMWVLTFERFWFHWFELKGRMRDARTEVLRAAQRQDPWIKAYRERAVSQVRLQAESRVWLIRTMVAVGPLLGLLGTVVGMLEVFDVMSISGNSNPRAMAAGVSRATITTLAGMAVALSGLFFVERLQRRTRGVIRRFRDGLNMAIEAEQEASRNGTS